MTCIHCCWALVEQTDEYFVRLALPAAKLAWDADEVPVGAILVIDGKVVGRGHNLVVATNDPTAHAEIAALRDAAKAIGNYRVVGSTLYSTIEPCAMRAGAIVHARVSRLVYGASDPRAGAVRTHFGICESARLNHRVSVEAGVLEGECGSKLVSICGWRRE